MTDIMHYFNPVDFDNLKNTILHPGGSPLLKKIEKNTKSITDKNFHKIKLAIFGLPDKNNDYTITDSIRTEFYSLAEFNPPLEIVDFGNLKLSSGKKATLLALRDITGYLLEFGITALVIGSTEDNSIGICKAFDQKPFFTFSSVSPLLDFKKGKESLNETNYLYTLFGDIKNLFQFNLIAYQEHLVSKTQLNKAVKFGQHLRLGEFRDNPQLAEPFIRDTNFLSFDMDAVKFTESPANQFINPNGLTCNEACHLAYFAGLSQNLSVFALFNSFTSIDTNKLSPKLAAQIIWYFIHGCCNRQFIQAPSPEKLITYNVTIKKLENPLLFYKETDSNRWWMEIKSLKGQTLKRACTERDYQEASNDEIPELWLKYMQKLDEV